MKSSFKRDKLILPQNNVMPDWLLLLMHGVQRRMGFSGQFFRIFQIIIFCFVADMCDLVHDAEAIHDLY